MGTGKFHQRKIIKNIFMVRYGCKNINIKRRLISLYVLLTFFVCDLLYASKVLDQITKSDCFVPEI